MDLKGIRLREISHTEKDKYHKISLKCGIEKTHRPQPKKTNKNTNLQIQRIACQLPDIGGETWAKWIEVVNWYKLPVTK